MDAIGGARARGELVAGCAATIQPQMLEDAADDLRIFDAGDDLEQRSI
jgi:hypothetical protein